MRLLRLKGFALAVLSFALALGGSGSAWADEWKQDGIGWWCEREDGTYPISTWYEDSDGSWYFLDERGYMISNCYRYVDGSIYAFGDDGKWTGTVFSDILPGSWAGNRYVNGWSGFSMNVPEGYQILDASATGTIGAAKTMVEFVIYAPDETGSAIELEYADAYDFANGAATTPEYIVTLHGLQLAAQGYAIEDVSQAVLGGKEYLKLSASLMGVVKRELYCRKAGEHFFECLSTVYWLDSKPALDGLLANIDFGGE